MMLSSQIASSVVDANRVALVTGANKGIGFFLALNLAYSGLFREVILGCRDASRGKAAAQQIEQRLKSTTTISMGGPQSVTRVTYLPLEVGNQASHAQLRKMLEERFGKLDVLVNNAAIAFKGSDPTPFHEQTKPTLDVNFRGTVDLTEELLPLLRKGHDARIVNVASRSGYLSQIRPDLQKQFADPNLTIHNLQVLVDKFEQDVKAGTLKQNGWGSSNYGLSKLALIAATKVWARRESAVKVNCFCPGYCKTDMTSNKGIKPPDEGAQTGILLATMTHCPTGEFYHDMHPSEW
jgi:carbonyl reductase 1